MFWNIVMIVFPWLANIALMLFARYGFDKMPVSRFWLWAIFIMSFCPVLNILTFFAGSIFIIIQASDSEAELKDCKFNRYFFNKFFE